MNASHLYATRLPGWNLKADAFPKDAGISSVQAWYPREISSGHPPWGARNTWVETQTQDTVQPTFEGVGSRANNTDD